MRNNDFHVELLIDLMETHRKTLDGAIAEFYPDMTQEDLTEEEREYITAQTELCDYCYNTVRFGNLTYNTCQGAYLCDICDEENYCDDEYDDYDDYEDDEEEE